MLRVLPLLLIGVLAFGTAASSAEVPEAIRTVEIGKSIAGRSIRGVLVGLEGEVPLEERPRLLVVAGLHADHRVGVQVASALAPRLLERAGEDPGAAALLMRCAVEILPLINPDGAAALAAGPERELRTNVRPLDADRDGTEDEDGPEDLDGDGRITWIRVADPAGEWRLSDEDPRLMVRADPARGERGTYRLLPEGRDVDGDGEIAEDPPGGVDLDRNFAHGWAEHDPAAGTCPPSEPETRALIEHVLGNPKIAAVLVYGRHDNLVKDQAADRSKGRRAPTGPLADDLALFHDVSRRFREITGATGGTDDPADGAFHQWAYYQRGLPAFSTPVFYGPMRGDAPVLASGTKPTTDEGRWLAWSDEVVAGAGFVPWAPFEHPDLGPVEIGGFSPLLRVTAPPDRLASLVDEQATFVMDLVRRLPAPALARCEAARLAEGLYEIRATLVNEGFFPLITAMAARARAGLPIRVSIDRSPDSILQGNARVLTERLTGPNRSAEYRWVVRGHPGESVTVTAWTQKAGSFQASVELPEE